MINKLVFLSLSTFVLLSCNLYADTTPTLTTVKWYTNYEEASQASKSTAKPLLLFFTGSDWCGWCTKLDEEAFDNQEFAQNAADKFIFVRLDFPLYITQDPSLKEQNKQLQLKFDVRSFPAVVLWDSQLSQPIGSLGYRPGGGCEYADHLNKLVKEFAVYKQKVGSLETEKFSGALLKQLYEKSKALHLTNDTNAIVKSGMESDESLFFLTERYHYLANEGQMHSKEAVAVRQRLLMGDPNNEDMTHYKVALIEFEAYGEEMAGKNTSAELATAPLVAYIEKFGAQDKEHTWRLKIIISQVYLDKDQMKNALKYAQESYDSAPACVQADLSRAIKNIRARIHS